MPATRDRKALAAWQRDRFHALLEAVLATNPFYRAKLAGFAVPNDPLAELPTLPFTTKAELLADQAAHPPYGTNLTFPVSHYVRLHQTSGTAGGRPLRWLDTPASWQWILDCWRTIFAVVGLEPADRLFFPFSFGPFLGFWAAFAGAARLGHFVLPGGGLNTGARLRFLLDNGITVVCCTPTYALRMAEVAAQEGLDLAGSPVRMLILAGEPGGSIAGTRQRIEAAWGARAFDHTGMTEIGSLGIECRENPGGVHLLETDCIAEIIDPETGRLVSREQEGELVLTNLGRWGSPLLRYRTGDRVLADPEPCPCGRVWLRLAGGIRGRTDDMLIVKGVNVYPSAVEDVVRRFATVDEFRLVVAAGLTVELECAAPPPRLAEEVAAAVQTALLFRPEVRLVAPGTLPRPEMKSRRVVRA